MMYLIISFLSFIAGALMMYFAYPIQDGVGENVQLRGISEEDRRIERRNAYLKEIEHQNAKENPVHFEKTV